MRRAAAAAPRQLVDIDVEPFQRLLQVMESLGKRFPQDDVRVARDTEPVPNRPTTDRWLADHARRFWQSLNR